MCQFISWVEEDDKVFFLTKKELQSKKGKALIKYCDNKDLQGHGACKRYFFGSEGSKRGVQKECSDFSSPHNFPEKIALAIIRGDFNCKYFDTPIDILTQLALAEYEKIEQSAWAEYKKIKQPAFYKLIRDKNNLKGQWKLYAWTK